VRIRTRIAEEPLVPAVKAMVAHVLKRREIGRTMPPFVDLPAEAAARLGRDVDGLTG
jgi:hypothetical protein